MTNICTKVTVRKRPIKNGQVSLYLDKLSLALKPSNYLSLHCTENSDASLFISTLTAHSVSR